LAVPHHAPQETIHPASAFCIAKNKKCEAAMAWRNPDADYSLSPPTLRERIAGIVGWTSATLMGLVVLTLLLLPVATALAG
jgi:hypothetical protein